MWQMILGLSLGAVLCVLAALGVHKIFEYGVRNGLVQRGEASDGRSEDGQERQ